MKVRLPSTRFQALSQDSITPLLSAHRTSSSLHTTKRQLHATSPSSSSSSPTPTPSTPPRPNPAHWLSTTHARLGHCISFGLHPSQLTHCSQILSILTTEWRSLLAGREGYVAARAGVKRRKVVWGEMDSMGHVNNVMYVRYAETGRVEWICGLGNEKGEGDGNGGNGGLEKGRGSGSGRRRDRERWAELVTPKGERGLILKSIKVDYKFPMKWPDTITVFHKLRHSPSSTTPTTDPSSFILDVLILSEVHQRPAARCEEDIVIYDYAAGKKAPISGFIKEGFQKAWQEQEEEKARVEKRIAEVEEMVRKLEMDSWDRPGAVEDMGGRGGKP